MELEILKFEMGSIGFSLKLINGGYEKVGKKRKKLKNVMKKD